MTSNVQRIQNTKKYKTRLRGGQRGDKGGWSSRTFDLLFYMIIDLDRSKDLRWLLMSGAIFILRWSCFRTRFNDRAISIFLLEEVMKSDECRTVVDDEVELGAWSFYIDLSTLIHGFILVFTSICQNWCLYDVMISVLL